MIKLEIDDKKYKVPTSFEELTLEQFCRAFFNIKTGFEDGDDEVEIFKKGKINESTVLSRLLGEDDEFCLGLPINVYQKLAEATRFIYDSDYMMKNARAGIVIDGRRYSIPPLNEMPLRQYIDADVIIKEKENPLQYIELLSILLTSKDKNGKWIPYNGEYQELMGKIRELKCSEALPLVYHFFKKGYSLKRISEASMKVEENLQRLNTANS